MSRESRSNYKKIREQCFKEGKLFEDKDFPAHIRSIMERGINPNITWKRPHEIVEKPVFIRKASYYDLNQGELGNCWFICGLNSLIVNSKKKFKRVVPPKQGFEKSDHYAGIFHFRFWRFGKWIEVLIDDRLPVNVASGKLIFSHNSLEPDEFWSPLVEKAYAKLNGCYGNLQGGLVRNALADMTGGLSEEIILDEKRTAEELFDIINNMWKMNTMIGALIFGEEGQIYEKETKEGLFTNHAYAVTNIATVSQKGKNQNLIRLRNPWGKGEWKGKWSDGSAEWETVAAKERKRFELPEKNEGEFWISMEDVMKYFDVLDLCHQERDAFIDSLNGTNNKEKTDWNTVTYIDSWKLDISSGGSDREADSYWSNPQFLLDLENEKEEVPVIISLMEIMEKNRKRMDIFIGFDVHRIKKDAPKPLKDGSYSEESLRFELRSEKTEWRENTKYMLLKPWKYVIIPFTQKAYKESRFLLRVFSQNKVISSSFDNSTSIENVDVVHNDIYKPYPEDTEWLNAFQLHDHIKTLWTENKNLPPLTLETARCLFNMVDDDQLGIICLEEADQIKRLVSKWHIQFQECAPDGSNKAHVKELKNIYSLLGVDFGRKVFEGVAIHYADDSNKISFDDFLQSISKMLNSFWLYEEHVMNKDEQITKTDWMQLMLRI
ncbi:calpain-11-like [Argonauta hians]